MAGVDSTADTFSQGHGVMTDRFMQGQDGMGSTFPQDHEFPEDYNLEEEDEVDREGEPLFADELTQQASAQKKRRQSIRIKAYTKDGD